MIENGSEDGRSLSKLFPIVAQFGGDYDGGHKPVQYRTIGGVAESSDNPNHCHIYFTDSGPNIHSKWYLKMNDVFNILAEAHRKGEIADLTTARLFRDKLIQPQ